MCSDSGRWIMRFKTRNELKRQKADQPAKNTNGSSKQLENSPYGGEL